MYGFWFLNFHINFCCCICCVFISIYIYYSLRHSAGPPAFGLQAHSNGCVKLVGVKGWLDDGDDGDGGDDDDGDDDD